ncbi:1,4-alpha-glucan branching protein GlgB [soil metagenome]
MSIFTKEKEVEAVVRAKHGNVFAFMGMHGIDGGGVIVRVFRPGADRVSVVREADGGVAGEAEKIHPDGFFELVMEDEPERFGYRLRVVEGGVEQEMPDPYSFGNILGEQDIYYFGEGTHQSLYRVLGAHCQEIGGVQGCVFAVWAPNAQRVSVVGDFCHWDGRVYPMRKRIEAGVWEIFIPGIGENAHYKFELVGAGGELFLKSDPMAFFSQNGTQTASITWRLDKYEWGDAEYMQRRRSADYYHDPVSIYEVHLGSWARRPEEGNRPLSYRELADELVDYVVEMGFTDIELMPVAEFPFDGSWGYQVTGYFAPTSRFGNPDDFRYFVDRCHQQGVGVIVDWVPAHFPKDAHGLAQFDGTALYEHSDDREGEHKDWGTKIFNFGRTEVCNFLVSNAQFWFEQYHIDGLRVDAVASMLYRDYSRNEGEWVPNQYGGRENIEAIRFLRSTNEACYARFPGIMMIAEESTAWGGVSRPVSTGGLGFGFKWNMGWMHDYLEYMSLDPIHRQYHHHEATFSMIYAYDENFMLVLSHDEVVHGKKSLIDKMPGDFWQKFANLRMFYAWMFTHPGKKLLFQGAEIAQWREWDYDSSVDWHLADHKEHAGIRQVVKDLNRLYRDERALHEIDHEPGGFEWVEHSDAANSVFSYLRYARNREETLLVVVNATPIVRSNYRLGVPEGGRYHEIFNSDSELYGGSNQGNAGGVPADAIHHHGRAQSVCLTLPPLATIIFKKA